VNNEFEYTVDRLGVYVMIQTVLITAQQDTDAPSGFVNSVKVTATTADATLTTTQPLIMTKELRG
jgi:hypothetical protein